MEVCKLTLQTLEEARNLFNTAATSGETILKPMSEDVFNSMFLSISDSFHTVSLVGMQENKVIGFASGNTVPNTEKAYITYVQIAKEERRKGYGKQLLEELEKKLAEANPMIKKYELLFFNPHNLAWCIPGMNGIEHPNIPGVDMQSAAYVYFKNMGYRDFAYQNCYYLALNNYEIPEDIARTVENLKQRGITINLYDPTKHHGFDELFDNLNNEDWRNVIQHNNSREDRDPVIIAESNGTIVGFTGPISVQSSGRGYFAGIGVYSDYRGGTGKLLFTSLCKELKGIGAKYMTLFTGENNPARNIYEVAGFKIVRCFSDMRKEI